MAKKAQTQDILSLTQEEIDTLNKAAEIIIQNDPVARRSANSEAYVKKVLNKTKGYFDSPFESRLALLSLSVSEGNSVLDRLNGSKACGNNCQGKCKISCVTYCKGTCKGGCKGGLIYF